MEHHRFIIVGQGLAGTLLSFFLLEQQIEHVVIAHPNQPSASQVAAGMYNPLVFKRITKSWKADLLLPFMHQVYERFEKLLQKKFTYPLPIARLIHPDEKKLWESRIESQQIQSYFQGFYHSLLIADLNPEYEIALISQSGWVNVPELIEAYHQFLSEKQMLIESELNYSDLIIQPHSVTWQNLQAEGLIFCEGAYAVSNPYFPNLPFYLTKGDVLRVGINGLSPEYIINKDIFILPKTHNQFIIGSNYVHGQTNWNPSEESKEFVLKKVKDITQLPIKILEHTSGIRPTVKDRRPILGKHPQFQALAIFNGLGTKGVMLAPYYANQMVRFLTEPGFSLPDEIALSRFN